MLASTRRVRQVHTGWAVALEQYRRLCADPEAGAYNVTGAVVILQEALPLYAPQRHAILQVVAAASAAVSPRNVSHVLKMGFPPPTTVSTMLLNLYNEGLLDREWQRHGPPVPGGKYVYILSDLGKMVMGQESSSNGAHDLTENGRS